MLIRLETVLSVISLVAITVFIGATIGLGVVAAVSHFTRPTESTQTINKETP